MADVVVVSRVGAMWVVLGKLSKQFSVVPTILYPTATVLSATAWEGDWETSNPVWIWAETTYLLRQGAASDGAGGYVQMAGVWYLPGVPAALPAGATVTAAKLRLTRWGGDLINPESTLVTPRLRMHTYTAAPVGAPTWTGTAWSPGTLAAGQAGVWDLPSTWLTALLAGTATGIGLDSTAYADFTAFWFSDLQVELSYSVPA